MTIARPKSAVAHTIQSIDAGASIGIKLRVGYGIGQLGVQILRDMPTVLLPAYVTLILGLPPWLMSVVIFVPKLWIMFADILFGTLSDRTNSRWGRRRPYLFIGALAAPISLFALFAGPQFSENWMRVAYAMIAYAVTSSAYSIFSVPYLSMGAELSPDSRERTKIMSVRTMFLAGGLIVGTGATPWLIAHFGGGREGYRMMSVVLGIVCFAAMLGCFFGTRGVRSDAGVRETFSVVRQWAVIRANRPFLLLAAFHLLQVMAGAMQNTVFLFFMIYVGGNLTLLLPMTMINSTCVILAQPFWVRMTLHFGKKQVYLGALIGWCVLTLSWFFVHRGGATVVALPGIGALTLQDLGLIGRYCIAGFFNGALTLLSVSMLTDTVEHDRKVTGVGQEGVYSGAWSAMEKVAVAMGPLFMGPFLQLFGFEHATTGMAAQTTTAILGVAIGVAVIPSAVNLLTIPFVLRYPAKSVEE